MYEPLDLDIFKEMSFCKDLIEMCKKQGLALGGIEYKHGEPSKYTGTYIYLCPSLEYVRDLQNNLSSFEKLLKTQEDFGPNYFNPYYYIINISDYDKNNSLFAVRSALIRAIQTESITVNAFRELDYSRFPTVIEVDEIVQLWEMDQKRSDTSLPVKLREEYQEGYKEYVRYLYKRSLDIEKEYKETKNCKKQMVDYSYFEDRGLSTVHEVVCDDFRKFLMKELRSYPEFRYSMSDTPDTVLPDVSKLARKVLKRNHPLFKDKVKEGYYDIFFPKGLSHIYYTILLKYNTRMLHNPSESIEELEKPLLTFVCRASDLCNFDSYAGVNDVKYYINHGDLTQEMNAEETQNVTIAIAQKDEQLVYSILNDLSKGLLQALPVSRDQVDRNAIRAAGKRHYNPALGICDSRR